MTGRRPWCPRRQYRRMARDAGCFDASEWFGDFLVESPVKTNDMLGGMPTKVYHRSNAVDRLRQTKTTVQRILKQIQNILKAYTEGWLELRIQRVFTYKIDHFTVQHIAFGLVRRLPSTVSRSNLLQSNRICWLEQSKTRLLALSLRHERTSRMSSYTMQYKEEDEEQQQQPPTVVLNTRPKYKTGRCPDDTLSI